MEIGTPSESWAHLEECLNEATSKEVYEAFMLADEWCGTGSDRDWEHVYEDVHFNPLAQSLCFFIGWISAQQCYAMIPPCDED